MLYLFVLFHFATSNDVKWCFNNSVLKCVLHSEECLYNSSITLFNNTIYFSRFLGIVNSNPVYSKIDVDCVYNTELFLINFPSCFLVNFTSSKTSKKFKRTSKRISKRTTTENLHIIFNKNSSKYQISFSSSFRSISNSFSKFLKHRNFFNKISTRLVTSKNSFSQFKTSSCEKISYCSECTPISDNNENITSDDVICTSCETSYYLYNNTCQKCSLTCNTCKEIATQCTSCYEGVNYLREYKCTQCQNCASGFCYQKGCTQCVSENYYREYHDCLPCDKSCKSCYGKTTQNCLSCYNGSYLFNKMCVLCDINCALNSCIDNIGCVKCVNESYAENGVCHFCNNIENCIHCDSEKRMCLECTTNFSVNSEGVCVCKDGYYLSSQNACLPCYTKYSNCKKCYSQDNEYDTFCVECYTPYILTTNNTCEKCSSNHFFDNGKCRLNTVGCLKQINNNTCLMCQTNFYLQNFTCKENTEEKHCLTQSSVTCEDCGNSISVSGMCINEEKCKYIYSSYSKDYYKCFQCEDNLLLSDDNKRCINKSDDITLIRNDVLYACLIEEYLNQNNKCRRCNDNSTNIISQCILFNSTLQTITCEEKFVYDIHLNECYLNDNCVTIQNGDCVKCDTTTSNSYLQENKCVTNNIEKCNKYSAKMCITCTQNYLLSISNTCEEYTLFNCEKANSVSCIQCTSNTMRSGDSTYCTFLNNTIKYLIKTFNSKIIINECEKNYILYNNSCHVTMDDTTKSTSLSLCQFLTPKGCLRCFPTYYIDHNNNTCQSCLNSPSHCLYCNNQTFCTKCDTPQYYLNSQNQCELSSQLQQKCALMMPNNIGCALCKSSYYRKGDDCISCDISCAICIDSFSCITCQKDYFYIQSETPLCQNYDNLTHCILKSSNGCVKCENGYYLDFFIPRCVSCPEMCLSCTSYSTCTLCEINFILLNGVCSHFSILENCAAASNNTCTKCKNNKKVSKDKLSCDKKVNIKLAISLPVAIIILLIVLLIVLIVFIRMSDKYNNNYKKMKNICVFKMKHSNIRFARISLNLVSNIPQISFGGEKEANENNEISVEQETRALYCVGNISDDKQRVQFSVLEDCELYEIRTVPEIVILNSDEACEFEIFIKPNCSCYIEDVILCISVDLKTGEQTSTKIEINAKTIKTTKLNNSELLEDSKVGEGSFGVVYKGKFRDNIVAIKRLKNTTMTENAIKEFEKEVSMLDKFRCDYIVHFYGAVLIPNKLCLVTEFAQFGSLKDLINKTENVNKKVQITLEMPSKKLKVKYLCDMARGILYLHNNGIVHRDIKPDNLLIFSMEEADKFHAKLTDFGSARNVNLLMTNMTFTRGIGTPKYMAPEILKKEKYTMSSDVYSFAITMFETFSWKDPFPKVKFGYAWNVANFVSSGKHLEKDVNISNEEFKIIEEMWCFEEYKRIKIGEVVQKLELLNL
ncbi:protein serine/threonine kinase, putative [Entamoeba invadens IP1]|uniref:Protein serine/threonine kinase, putative n=1 Tax=Entamoeba invadens IP1 TaxID=370355 RepID=A0A0A1TW69_ENTIV|nr:protein serine/threonine kinase, putative [Entamoeba invadens IP1]ELP84767.1 protein serine/threonine kinase, putative [Entamoeba invadens IP1]|eukprot:XP_004184113.1 protein serine/threonine kinase, putative [Entamoeba invadens IP1]